MLQVLRGRGYYKWLKGERAEDKARAEARGEPHRCASLTLPNVPLPSVLPTRNSAGPATGRERMCVAHKLSDVAWEGTALPSACPI